MKSSYFGILKTQDANNVRKGQLFICHITWKNAS